MDLTEITLLESIYLFYMFFLFKTSYSFNYAIFDKDIQSVNSFFVHDHSLREAYTPSRGYNKYENKICDFGKVMAVIAIILAWYRVYNMNEYSKNITIGFDIICVILAGLMNMNALIYILPLVIGEIYIINNLS